MRTMSLVVLPLIAFAMSHSANNQYKKGRKESKREGAKMKLTSPSFKDGQPIDKKFTCEGENVSPELRWEGVPAGTQSLALICDDPDAPSNEPWVHWVVFNLPPDVTTLKENVSIASLGGLEGITNFGKNRYGGPCPPPGHGTHHYFFKLYALDTKLDLSEGATKDELLGAMKDHVLDQTQLMGTYERY